MVKGIIGHIILNVKEFNRSEKFYDKLLTELGFSVDHIDRGDWGIMKSYKQGDHNLWIRFSKDPKNVIFVREVGLDHLAFKVKAKNDVDALYEVVKTQNVKITRKPEFYPDYSPSYYAFYFRDPDNIPLEIYIQ